MKLTPGTEIELYHRLADCVGDTLLSQRWPTRRLIVDVLTAPGDERSAVYVVIGGSGDVLYVGSVCRAAPGAVATRLREHLAEGHKAASWDSVWTLPIHLEGSQEQVRLAEGRVATLTGRPPHCRAVPNRPPPSRGQTPALPASTP
ncbi:hypothetical protein ACIRG5_41450 [Lentzea sp. NPDC102401]|uniref:hypothetical protein n=1 Tax=Lentzea sp. NPDC102401 TaxID=3364128 RepID=UPI0037F4E1E2